MSIKAVIFDLDNTLINRDEMFRKYCLFLIDRYIEALPSEREALVEEAVLLDGGGYGDRDLLYSTMKEKWNIKAEKKELMDHWGANMDQFITLFDDTVPVLAQLKSKYKLSIITNGYTAVQNYKIACAGIEAYFDEILISESIGTAKPSPEAFEIALDRLKISAYEAVYVGDYYKNDIAGALNAGLKAIWLGGDPEKYSPVITSLSELDAAIAELNK